MGRGVEGLYRYIEYCSDEGCISDELAVYVGGRREVQLEVGGFRVLADVVAGADVYEVKLDAEPYEGIGQALLYGAAGLRPHLVHVLDGRGHLFERYVGLYEGLGLGFCVHVLAMDGRYWEKCP